MMKKLIVLATLAVPTSAALAGSVTARFDKFFVGNSNATAVTYHLGSSTTSTLAGLFEWTSDNETFLTYCIELTEFISYGATYTYDTTTDLTIAPQLGLHMGADNGTGPMSLQQSNQIRRLWADHWGNAFSGTAFDQAAFQVALWEIVFENTNHSLNVGLNEGHFWVEDDTLRSQANALLSTVNSAGPYADLIAWTATQRPDRAFPQDQVTWNGSPGSLIPNPAAFGVGLAGMTALIIRRRRA